MQTGGVWTSLEVAKLLISALTPIIVVVLGIWVARMTRRLEQVQWTGRKIIERRIDVYDEIAPMLNDLVVYFTFVGHWKELSPQQVIDSKRLLDRRVHVSAPLFSDHFLSAYFSFIDICFKTYQGWGTNARLRMDPKRHKEAAGSSWISAWNNVFCEESDRTDPQQVRSAYQTLIKAFAEELQLGLRPRSIPSGGVPRNAARRLAPYPVAAETPNLEDSWKPVKSFYFYRLLPQELRSLGADNRIEGIASRRTRLWPNGSTLRIRFLDGSAVQQDAVRQFAREWLGYANIRFDFRDDPFAEIRVTFDLTKGSWSYIGTDCLQIPYDAATMNLASVDKGTVLHQFGLALGLMPEIQNPSASLDWNQETIFRDLSVCPDYSSADAAERYLQSLSVDQLNGTAFDRDSVMLMPIPNEWVADMQGTSANKELSSMDKVLIASFYPRN